MHVSIPHRYDKNYETLIRQLYVIRFQFLIGTIKTQAMSEPQSPGNRFQFLIGTIKTLDRIEYLEDRIYVSIPHRYDKNFPPKHFPYFEAVFQFLIGTIKT